jgi:hypothetical protein
VGVRAAHNQFPSKLFYIKFLFFISVSVDPYGNMLTSSFIRFNGDFKTKMINVGTMVTTLANGVERQRCWFGKSAGWSIPVAPTWSIEHP